MPAQQYPSTPHIGTTAIATKPAPKQQESKKPTPTIQQHNTKAQTKIPKARRQLKITTFKHSTPRRSEVKKILSQNTKNYENSQNIKQAIQNSDIFPANIPLKDDIGKLGLMWPRGKIANLHPAAKLLHEYSDFGCPLDCGPNWSKEQILTSIKRGPHISAKDPTAAECLHKETQEKIQGGYAKIISWGDIKNNIPPSLKISPVAMIPHKSRLYRCILDLSFQIKIKGTKLTSVNGSTKNKAPQKSMAQLGKVLRRLIATMKQNYNTIMPFYFSKCDIKDGFWRMVVNKEDAWNFCYVLPTVNTTVSHIDDTQIVVPHALQMGWSESPPFFCSASETARDIIQTYMDTVDTLPEHKLETHMYNNTTFSSKIDMQSNSINIIDVYVDDFIAATNNNTKQNIIHMSRAMLHGIHSIFPPPEITNHNGGDPISEKKLKKLEGLWDTQKEILGWMINGKDYTIHLPQEKQEKYNSSSTTHTEKRQFH